MTNCYIAGDRETGDGVIIDPGGDADYIYLEAGRLNFNIKMILLTHAHVDHVGGAGELQKLLNCEVRMHKSDYLLLKSAPIQAPLFGMKPFKTPKVENFVKDGDSIQVGSIEFKVIHIPGHSPGGICFYYPGILFTGDTLFQGSIGRTDLPGGNYETLISGIKEKILILPDETVVYPGHGPPTTVGDEKRYNPFLF